jgi:uncharacterized repeat protein (TIGR03803 family)
VTFSCKYWPLNSRATRLSRSVGAALVFALTVGFGGAASAQGQTLKVLHSFSLSDGQNPTQGLVRDVAGNLYGIAPYGGIFDENCDPEFGGGTVFRLDLAGKFTVLHAFDNKGDGCDPTSLIEDAAGNLYGTTSLGTVFRIDTAGKFTVLYTFNSTSELPVSLFRDVRGNIYGTTAFGGNGNCNQGIGCGTVFELNTNGTERVLYSFTGSPDGFEPRSGLVRDARASGNFYGTTTNGGYLACPNGCGTVFKVNKPGIETVLYTFKGGADGANPGMGALLYVSPGTLYGTAGNGGDPSCYGGQGCGVVFEVEGNGTEIILHAFNGADGSSPNGGLIRDAMGNFYGTTVAGGTYGSGTAFKLDSEGTLIVLHHFNTSDGASPWAGLIRDSAGNLYGTTQAGGSDGYGTVFEITP